MSRTGKKYVDATRKFDRDHLYTPAEALDLVKSLAKRNFDETVEITFRLGIDPRKADQMIRGTASLTNGTGKDVRVAVFAAGDAAREAQEAGADVVGADDLVARVQEGFLDFDVAIATPDLMSQVGRLGRTLGPRGVMPNPKTGRPAAKRGPPLEARIGYLLSVVGRRQSTRFTDLLKPLGLRPKHFALMNVVDLADGPCPMIMSR